MKRGDVISGYNILSMLGKGGMARVYEVEKDGVKYAMKVCVPQGEDDVPRFKREYRMLSSIHHQNVITVFDEGEVDGVPYYIMERGQSSLADLVNRKLSKDDKFKYVIQVCQGVEAIHSSGVIHRDLKPNNVIACDGILKVSDFGLGRFVQRDTISLTVTGETTHGAPCSRCRKDSSCREASPVLSRAQSPWADCHRARAALISEASTHITKRSRNTGSESEKVGFGLGGAWVTWLWRSVDLCTQCVRKYT